MRQRIRPEWIIVHPALSPDGRWLAFETSQSVRPEVVVARFPSSQRPADASAPRWQLSTQGGSRPRWSGDGGALLLVSLDDGSLTRSVVRATRDPSRDEHRASSLLSGFSRTRNQSR